jgi:hypothetical protein
LQANLVDERGRADTFRRLKATVAGPDGFTRTVELEAVGNGAYQAILPLDRPGSYVATALDEVTGSPLGIAGAALGAGEELRPTGTDRALLRRVTELSQGKLRDTLAGIFEDRPPRRFAYSSLTTLLTLLAALGLLFMVAARRLALPEAVANLPAQVREKRALRRERREARRSARDQAQPTQRAAGAHAPESPAARGEPAPSPPAQPAATNSLEALRQAKARTRAAAGEPRTPGTDGRSAREAQPPPAARVSPPLSRPPPPREPTAGRTSVPPPSRPGGRQLSAAEILLQRRKGRQR